MRDQLTLTHSAPGTNQEKLQQNTERKSGKKSGWSKRIICTTGILIVLGVPFALEAKRSRFPSKKKHPEVRTIDGTENSEFGDLGATHTRLLRIAPSDYPGDGSGEEILTSAQRTNPRTISNVICAQGPLLVLNDRELSDWVWAWGQFLDHDIDLTEGIAENGSASIEIEDPLDILGPFPIPFTRSNFDPSTGTADLPRQQINEITTFIDASNVYGSDQDRADALREFQKGRLKTSSGNLLPFNESGEPNAGGESSTLFVAGDIRANENVVLSSIHTLFVREHNRLAHQIATQYPYASDEHIYQLARRIVGAQMQIVTYAEFLPALLGDAAPTLEECQYDPGVDPSIANEFSTALYRFGHSLLSPNLILREQGEPAGEIALRDAFFNPSYLADTPQNLDRLLEGLAYQLSQNVDTLVVDDVRNFLFGPPGAGGFDLASLNIQRGRDHGLADYNTVREAYGLSLVNSFADITSDPVLQDDLLLMYGTVDNIDTWVGGLAEDHLPGSSVGPLLATALHDQFCRLIAGDRFSFLNDSELESDRVLSLVDLRETTLADLVRRNTTINELPDNVFFVGTGVTTDVTASYHRGANRLIVHGNGNDNSLRITKKSNGVRIEALDGSLINGETEVFIATRRRPNLTIDLGLGEDFLELAGGDWNQVLSTFLPEDDEFLLAKGTKIRKLATDLKPKRQKSRRNPYAGWWRNHLSSWFPIW